MGAKRTLREADGSRWELDEGDGPQQRLEVGVVTRVGEGQKPEELAAAPMRAGTKDEGRVDVSPRATRERVASRRLLA